MKLTIEIDNVHAPELLRFLADLNPDQQITSSSDEADVRWAPLPEIPSEWSETIAAADPLKVAMDDPVEDTRPRLIPQPGKKYRTRHGRVVACINISDISIECMTEFGDEFYYLHDGEPRASKVTAPEWDCVEEITEPVADEPEDPTRRDLPMLTIFPALPPLPEGKTRWVYRGTFENLEIPANDRVVYYACISDQAWSRCLTFSTGLHHIEAV